MKGKWGNEENTKFPVAFLSGAVIILTDMLSALKTKLVIWGGVVQINLPLKIS